VKRGEITTASKKARLAGKLKRRALEYEADAARFQALGEEPIARGMEGLARLCGKLAEAIDNGQ
jgi:hypothetical protein